MLLNVSILGFIFALIILVFSSYKKNISAFLAAYFLFLNLYSLIYFVIFENENPKLAAIFAINFTPFYFLTIPFLHLFVISHRKDFRFKPIYFLFFAPFLISLINISPYLLVPFSEKLVLGEAVIQNSEAIYRVKLLFLPYYYQSLLRPTFNLVFLLYTCLTYYKKRDSFEFLSAKFNERNFIFIILIITVFLNGLSFIFIVNKLIISGFDIALLSNVSYTFINSVVNYLTAAHNLLLLFFPQILFRDLFHVDKSIRRKKNQVLTEDTSISKERLIEIDQLIQDYVQNRPYLTKGFTLTSITKHTGIPVHQLSIFFNDYLKISFNDWKNSLRIEYAVSEIQSGKLALYTIETIAITSGFSSRSNFNKAFIEIMNQTPSEYIKGLKK